MQITDIVVRQAKPSDPCKPSCPRRKRQANAPLMRVSAIGSTETWPALTAWRTSTQKKRTTMTLVEHKAHVPPRSVPQPAPPPPPPPSKGP
jgi:hypothetical protein